MTQTMAEDEMLSSGQNMETETETETETEKEKEKGFKLNADAPEFRPTSHLHNYNHHHLLVSTNDDDIAISPYFSLDGTLGSPTALHPADLFCVTFAAADQHHHPSSLSPTFHVQQLKLIKQVEYLFSDLSLLANDTMAKHAGKDPQGYVPIPVIASMKKIKMLITDHHFLAQALRSSTKLVVSKDGKKVKRRTPFTENYKEELQGRMVVVENLSEDHSYQKLEKIFSVVGVVKAIRICYPPDPNPCRSKNEVIISNKVDKDRLTQMPSA